MLCPRLVGRDVERDELLRRLGDRLSGVSVVVGMAGSGNPG